MGNLIGLYLKNRVEIPAGIRVLHAEHGRVYQSHPSSMHAGDVIKEHPSHYLCRLVDLRIGHRTSPLPPNTTLDPSRTYILLHMRTLHSRVTREDLAFFSASLRRLPNYHFPTTTTTKGKPRPRKRSGGRILPLVSSSSSLDRCQAQYGTGGEKLWAWGGIPEASEVRSCQAQPFTRSRSLRLAGGDSVQARKMRRSLSWAPKLESIGERDLLGDNKEAVLMV